MKILKSRSILRAFAAGLVATALLTGCSATVNLEAAPLANNPACAEITVRLPDAIGDQTKRVTNAQATGAWGEPSSVILRCGLEPVAVSTLTCVTAGEVDWLVDDSQAPSYRFITFGRSPATEVIVSSWRDRPGNSCRSRAEYSCNQKLQIVLTD
jgi:hypothetical protein